VSTLEDRLRDAFSAEAATVKAESISGPPGQPSSLAAGLRRPQRRPLITLASAVAVVVVVALTAALPLLRGRAHPAARQTSALAAGVPRFFVSDVPLPMPNPGLIVRSTQTGKITGEIKPLHGLSYGSVAAIDGGPTFVAAVPAGSPCRYQLERFRLNDRGQPGSLVPMNITVLGDFPGINTLAVTPDGRTLAYATYVCGQARDKVTVVNLATGHTKVWTNTTVLQGLSLSADGRLLAFAQGGGPELIGGPEWLLDTSAPAGSLIARSRLISRTIDWAALVRNGASLDGCTLSSQVTKHSTLTYFSRSLASPAQHVIARYRDVPFPMCSADPDPTDHYLLIQLEVNLPKRPDWTRPVILDLRSGRTTVIPGAALFNQVDVAW
jgi:hypothetical protein